MEKFIRKFRSLLKKINKNIINIQSKFKIFLLEENVKLGKNVYMGKNTTIRTTDGGRIFIGDNVSIEGNCYIYAQNGEIVIGNNSFIGFGSQIVAKDSIQIGDNCLISAYSIIRDANHGIRKGSIIASQKHTIEHIIIKDDVWLGSHSVVTAGVTIEAGVVVGANGVVTKNIDNNSVVGGVPVRFIKKRIGEGFDGKKD